MIQTAWAAPNAGRALSCGSQLRCGSRPGCPLKPSYTRQLQDVAAAAVEEADFSGAPQQARAAINELIAEQTAGKITNLLGRDAVTAATRLVLANAVYLKARWAFPFTATATRTPRSTRVTGAEPITVAMMHRTASLPYVRGDGYQAVLLPYEDLLAGHGDRAARRPAGRAGHPARRRSEWSGPAAGRRGPAAGGRSPAEVPPADQRPADPGAA